MTALLERIPPYDELAERAVLGAMMLEPLAADIACTALDAQDFYLKAHRELFGMLLARHGDGEPMDEVSLRNAFQEAGILDVVGGFAYLSDLIGTTPNAANIEAHCQIVKQHSIRRYTIAEATKIIVRSHEGGECPITLASDLSTRMEEVAEGGTRTDEMPDIGEILERNKNLPDVDYIHTEMKWFDQLMRGHAADKGGLVKGGLVIVGGIPGSGKTTFMLDLARNLVLTGCRVGIFSYEMTAIQLANKILTAQFRGKTRGMPADDPEWVAFMNRRGQLRISDDCEHSGPALKVFATVAARRNHWDAIVVDYLQLMPAPPNKDTKAQEVGENAACLKRLAKKLGIPVIVASQLNRGFMGRPRLSNLKESGDIEAHADVVLFIHDDGKPESGQHFRTLIVAKNRFGPQTECRLRFLGQWSTFEWMEG